MARVRSQDIELEAAAQGDPGAPAVLLVRGLGTQLTQWPASLLEGLLDRGLRVLRFDNRDAGLSDKLDGRPQPEYGDAVAAAARGEEPAVPYTLADMAADAVAVLDHFGVERAHAVGISLGGMVVQHLAARHPQRVASAISVMSTSGAPGLPPPSERALAILYTKPSDPNDREEVLRLAIEGQRAFQGSAYRRSDDELRRYCEEAFDRCHHPEGVTRQMLAVVADGSRAELLAGIRVPFHVIHGSDDPLIPLACGADTAKRVPGARLEVIDGLGHDVAPAFGPVLADAIARFIDETGTAAP
ncbi:MAG: alpha/beta fold hydrolase [Myxococcota bacterium]